MAALADIEREAIVLQLMVEAVNSMVNHEIFGFSSNRRALQVKFSSLSQRALFNVLLADLLEPVDPKLLGKSGSLLESLTDVAATPHLGSKTHAQRLATAARRLTRWLDKTIVVLVWFPSINVNVRLRLRRRDFVSICGNISKHNPARLTQKARQLQTLLQQHDVSVDLTDALRALDDFHERFHNDVLVYHATYIAEMLNRIRWAIQEYLLPRYRRSYVPPASEADPRYSFRFPADLANRYARERFWDLMNSVRALPWIPQFATWPNLRGRY